MKKHTMAACLLTCAIAFAGCGTQAKPADSAASAAGENTASSASETVEESTASSASETVEESAASSASETAEESTASSASETTEESTASSVSEAAESTDPDMDLLMSLPLTEGEYELSDCIELGEYKGIELVKPSALVTDEQVEAQVKAGLTPEAVEDEDAVVEDGDTARISYEGKKDGVAFDGGTSDSYDLVIGSGTFIDGFEDGVKGMKKGETKDIPLTFPEEYHSEDLAGQDVVFTVTVKEILRTPELSDEWAASQEDGEYETLDAYMTHQKELMEEANEKMILQELQGDAWLAVQRASTFTQLPADYVTEGEELFEDSVIEEAAAYGMDLDAYLAAASLNKEDYELRKEQYGRYSAQSRLILEALIEAEDLSKDSDEYQEELTKLADTLGMSEEQVLEEHDEDNINQYLMTQIAANRVISYANVVEE